MKVKLTKEQADFIIGSYSIKADISKNIYYSVMAFTQNNEDEGTNIFEMEHISELDHVDILCIVKSIIYNESDDMQPIYKFNKDRTAITEIITKVSTPII